MWWDWLWSWSFWAGDEIYGIWYDTMYWYPWIVPAPYTVTLLHRLARLECVFSLFPRPLGGEIEPGGASSDSTTPYRTWDQSAESAGKQNIDHSDTHPAQCTVLKLVMVMVPMVVVDRIWYVYGVIHRITWIFVSWGFRPGEENV